MPETVAPLPLPRSAFHGLLSPGRHGAATASEPPGIVVQERTGLSIVHVAAFRGRTDAVRDAVQRTLGLTLPQAPRRVADGGLAALWAGPEQWMLLASEPAGPMLEARLASALDGLAAVTEIGDGRAVLRLAGPQARAVLAKGVAIDLHPDVFGPGATALTLASMIDVQLSRLSDEDGYELILFRSLAGSLWHWLEESAAEHGIEVLPPA